MSLDILSHRPYPANVLSNFHPNEFEIDGIRCASMEGFLQSLKFRDGNKRLNIVKLTGFDAKSAGSAGNNWKGTHTLYWDCEEYYRHGPEYQDLLARAYDALAKNPKFAKALLASYPSDLKHSSGTHDANLTILTVDEFIKNLNRVRLDLRRDRDAEEAQFLADMNQFEEICERNEEWKHWLLRLPEASRASYRYQIELHSDRDALIEMMRRSGAFSR